MTVLMHSLDLKFPKPFRQENFLRKLIRISTLLFCIIGGAESFLYRYCAIMVPGLYRFCAVRGGRGEADAVSDNILPEGKIASKGKTVGSFPPSESLFWLPNSGL